MNRFLLFAALVFLGFYPHSAQAGYLDPMPNTQACHVMKSDIDPGMSSTENREDIEFMFNGTVQQGRDGQQCNLFRGDRTKLQNDSSLHLSGISQYSRERVFAWGRLCLLDWCDMSGGTGAPATSTPKIAPQTQQKPQPVPTTPKPSTPRVVAPRPPPATAPRSQPQQDQGQYTFRICNETGKTPLWVAVGLLDKPGTENNFVIVGWWQIPHGQCKDWKMNLGPYSSHNIAFHAEADVKKGKSIDRYVYGIESGTKNICVGDAHRSYRRVSTPGYQCQAGERLEKFWTVQVKKGLNTITIRP